jgi:hypothetical protein
LLHSICPYEFIGSYDIYSGFADREMGCTDHIAYFSLCLMDDDRTFRTSIAKMLEGYRVILPDPLLVSTYLSVLHYHSFFCGSVPVFVAKLQDDLLGPEPRQDEAQILSAHWYLPSPWHREVLTTPTGDPHLQDHLLREEKRNVLCTACAPIDINHKEFYRDCKASCYYVVTKNHGCVD